MSTKPTIQLVPYTAMYAKAVRDLNYEWLLHYFKLEPSDVKSLNNLQEEIIDKGGFIFVALLAEKPVGTFSFLKKTDTVFELGKMAVSTVAQGKGIGTFMLEKAIAFAIQQNWDKILLYSNTQLKAALHLYYKYGFKEVALEPGLYDRADIKLEKVLV